MTYVILTSKPGLFRSEPTPGFRPVEAWEYRFMGALKAQFVIAELADEAARLRIVDIAGPPVVNILPPKFLPRFETVEAARAELQQLTRYASAQAELVPA